jgi:hypothetical protein
MIAKLDLCGGKGRGERHDGKQEGPKREDGS